MSQAKAVEVREGLQSVDGLRNVYVKIKNNKIFKYQIPLSANNIAQLKARLETNNVIKLKHWDEVSSNI